MPRAAAADPDAKYARVKNVSVFHLHLSLQHHAAIRELAMRENISQRKWIERALAEYMTERGISLDTLPPWQRPRPIIENMVPSGDDFDDDDDVDDDDFEDDLLDTI